MHCDSVLFLIDSNIAIACDPLGLDLEPGADLAMRFYRLATTKHHDLRVHEASLVDFGRMKDAVKREVRLRLFEKYEALVNPPPVSTEQAATLGVPAPGSNDAVDQELLAAIVGDAAEYLVTEDDGIHRKARRMGVDDRVLFVSDAMDMLTALYVTLPQPPPALQRVKTHELNLADPIFDGLREDYDGFDDWFRKAARNQRDALLVADGDAHAGLCILKPEPNGEYGVAGPLLKLCTFKVSQGHSGQKYGELMLKAISEQAHIERFAGIYSTVFEKHTPLIALLEDFGFRVLPDVLSQAGELVLIKPSGGSPDAGLDALQRHVVHGPPFVTFQGTSTYMVPIEPRWHRVLFPDAEPTSEDELFSAIAGLTVQPFGNALRKAYLCNAPSRLLLPGDLLLFYRSHDEKAVFVVGICEQTIVSSDPAEIAAAVGRRTVYSYAEIESLARRGSVLVVLFRQDRILRDDPITLDDLQTSGLVSKWPQAISKVRQEGMQWLRQRLDE
jgi:GNAT superfamily N-acetyltransferase